MSELSTEDIKKIAWLARMDINETDIPQYAHSVTEILDFVTRMNRVNTDHLQPMAHPQDMIQRLREDVVTEENQRELLMQNAPRSERGLFLVPRVIE